MEPVLVVSCFGDVPDPLDGSIATLFIDSEITHSQPTRWEHWHLKAHTNRRLTPH
jgi:hypothetical protein